MRPNPNDYWDHRRIWSEALVIFYHQRLSHVRHGLPFAKRRAGKHRRDERLFVRKQKRPLNV